MFQKPNYPKRLTGLVFVELIPTREFKGTVQRPPMILALGVKEIR